MTCPYANAGCDYPSSECAGLCLHRVDAKKLTAPVSVHMGAVEQRHGHQGRPAPAGRLALALDAYRRFRSANRTRAEALGHALGVLRQRT